MDGRSTDDAEAIRKRGKPNKAARKRNRLCAISRCTAKSCSSCDDTQDTSHFDAAAIEAAVATESAADMAEAAWPTFGARHSREAQFFLYDRLQTLSRTSLRTLACEPTCRHRSCLRMPISDLANNVMANVGELLMKRRADNDDAVPRIPKNQDQDQQAGAARSAGAAGETGPAGSA